MCTACAVTRVNLYNLYCKTSNMSYSTSCTNLHVLQYKLYKCTCLTAQAVPIYMYYSTSCTHLHIIQYTLYRFTCLTVQAVPIYMYYSTSCTHLHVLQYTLSIFTCLTVQAVQIYMSYSRSCTNILTCITVYCKTCKSVQRVLYDMLMCTACTVIHVNWYSLCCKTCTFVQLVL
jgi:hypothetical protein